MEKTKILILLLVLISLVTLILGLHFCLRERTHLDEPLPLPRIHDIEADPLNPKIKPTSRSHLHIQAARKPRSRIFRT